MQVNAFFPTLDIGTDPTKIRDWAQATAHSDEVGRGFRAKAATHSN